MKGKGLILITAAFFLAGAAGAAYEYAGKWGSSGSGNGQFTMPHGVGVASSGNVYVADTGNYRIQYFTSTGSFLGKWGSSGSGNGQFNAPLGVAVNPNTNHVYVADSGNNRIQYFTPTGSFLGKWGSGGSGNGQFISSTCVAVASNGNAYVTDMGNHRVQ